MIEFRVTAAGVEKLAARQIEEWEAHEVFHNGYVPLRNKKNRAASHRWVGRTDGGRLLTLLVRESHDAGCWECVNGWEASAGERTLYTKERPGD